LHSALGEQCPVTKHDTKHGMSPKSSYCIGSAIQKYHLVQLDGPSIEHSLESSFPNSIL